MGGGQILPGAGCSHSPHWAICWVSLAQRVVGGRCLVAEGWYLMRGSSSCTQMLVTLQLLQLDSPPVAVVLCFGRTEGGRAGGVGRGGAAGARGTRPPRCLPSLLPLLFCIISCGAFGAKTVNSRPSERTTRGEVALP